MAVDRPESLTLPGDVELRYGIFVALGGAVTMLVAGLRLRRVELGEEPPR
jgi:hypothetical protein